MSTTVKTIEAGVLSIAYVESGPADGWPCILGHGFPYDVHAYSDTAPILAEAGARVIVPYLRGFGPTRFLKAETPRSGEQAALGADLKALMDALRIERATLGGYDWGGRAACIVAALRPDRVVALVSAIHTTSRTSRGRWSRRAQSKRRRSGTNIISIANADSAA
jgi:pimeloyl-ACP methyl ester carboxylesterase